MITYDAPQGSPEWVAARFGRPTASNFSRVVTSKGAPSTSLQGYAAELAGELFAGKSLDAFDGNYYTRRGQDTEAEAREFYAFTTDAVLADAHFVTLDDDTAGCTPDAFVGDDGLLEIKCLKAERHIAAVQYHSKHGKAPTDYIQQTQGQLWITGRAWVDLMFYHPDLPPLTIRQTHDVAFIAALKAGVAAVIAERDTILASLRHNQQHVGEQNVQRH